MESIKEDKAKEWLKEEAQRFFDPNGAPEYYERLVETMEQIFEAGRKKERMVLSEKFTKWESQTAMDKSDMLDHGAY
jgi:hypothetical protein